MGEHEDFDAANEQAWNAFRARLADHLAGMDDDDVLIVDTDPADETEDGAAPYVQFCGFGGDLVRCEVSGNAYLASAHRLDRAGIDAVVRLGWQEPAGPEGEEDASAGNFYLDLTRLEADRLALMAVRVLREVFGVVHPAFLAAEGLQVDPGHPPVRGAEPLDERDEPLATLATGSEALQALVDEAMTPYFGHAPRKDADGDIPVVTDSTIVYVRVLPDAPVIHLFCRVVRDVADVAAARFETGVLNRDGYFVKFTVDGDEVGAEVDLAALPFVPKHLRAMVHLLSARVDAVVDDLVERVGGVRAGAPEAPAETVEQQNLEGGEAEADPWAAFLDDLAPSDADDDGTADDPETVHPAMQTLLELDADRAGSVTPAMAAGICAWDRGLVLELISWNSREEIAWRRSRDQASERDDGAEAGVCEVERAHAASMVALLRGALRLVVEADAARHRASSPHLDSGRSTERAARADDQALPGLERPEEPGLFETDLSGGPGR